jgi:hypothetical protein
MCTGMMPRIPITQPMVECTEREIRANAGSDQEIAAKCLGDECHYRTISDMRRSLGLKKDRKTGELHPCPPRGKRTWEKSSMPECSSRQ